MLGARAARPKVPPHSRRICSIHVRRSCSVGPQGKSGVLILRGKPLSPTVSYGADIVMCSGVGLVERRGFEPLTSAVQAPRARNSAAFKAYCRRAAGPNAGSAPASLALRIGQGAAGGWTQVLVLRSGLNPTRPTCSPCARPECAARLVPVLRQLSASRTVEFETIAFDAGS